MMRATDFVIAAALTAAMSAPALAQTTNAPDERTGWFASAFVGANFGTSRDNIVEGVDDLDLDLDDGGASFDFGGSVGYTWNGSFGGEFIADYAPSVGGAGVLFVDEPSVSSYMGNIVWSVPLGEGKYQPFLSGGFGLIRVNADAFLVIGDPLSPDVSASQNMFGGNIGGGIMAFAGNVGFRGDIRYYTASGSDNLEEFVDDTTGDTIGNRIGASAFSGLSFWRGNVGLAFRW
jgi:Outer membrane protein beta-barrel domain